MLDYKDIIIKYYALGMSGREIARTLSVSKTGVNSFLNAFKECKTLSYPLPEGITNYGIASAVYGSHTTVSGRDLTYELPDYEAVAKDMSSRKNMTLVVLWNRYSKKCRDSGLKFYSYRQFCENYAKWCEENKESLHFNAVIGQKMEVDFAGKTFRMVDPLTGETMEIVVFVAVLPYSQYIYAEGIISTQQPTVAVITSLIKANISCRIALKTATVNNSLVVLDRKRAEKLTGKGDALLKLPGEVNPIRFQAPMIETTDISP